MSAKHETLKLCTCCGDGSCSLWHPHWFNSSHTLKTKRHHNSWTVSVWSAAGGWPLCIHLCVSHCQNSQELFISDDKHREIICLKKRVLNEKNTIEAPVLIGFCWILNIFIPVFLSSCDFVAPARFGHRSPFNGSLHLLPSGVPGRHPSCKQNQHEWPGEDVLTFYPTSESVPVW